MRRVMRRSSQLQSTADTSLIPRSCLALTSPGTSLIPLSTLLQVRSNFASSAIPRDHPSDHIIKTFSKYVYLFSSRAAFYLSDSVFAETWKIDRPCQIHLLLCLVCLSVSGSFANPDRLLSPSLKANKQNPLYLNKGRYFLWVGQFEFWVCIDTTSHLLTLGSQYCLQLTAILETDCAGAKGGFAKSLRSANDRCASFVIDCAAATSAGKFVVSLLNWPRLLCYINLWFGAWNTGMAEHIYSLNLLALFYPVMFATSFNVVLWVLCFNKPLRYICSNNTNWRYERDS